MEQQQSPGASRDPADTGAAEITPTAGEPIPSTRNSEPPSLDLIAPQFTLRAVLTGMALGAVLSVCNVYVGLIFGAAFGTSITATLLGYGFWGALHALSGRRIRVLGILENNISQTACSSAAYAASAGLVAPIPALALLTGQTLPWHHLALWVFSVMLVGIAVAIPLRRQLLVADKLRFPAGLASAEMLRELHERGGEALRRVIALGSAAGVGVAVKLLASFVPLVPYAPRLSISGFSLRSLTMTLNPSALLVGIGGLIGFRACCSLLVGAVLAYAALSPPLLHNNSIRVTVRQPLTALPAGVAFPPDQWKHIRYDEARHVLAWSGIMSGPERDELLALSDEASYQQAIRALYAASQSPVPSFVDLNRWLLWPGATLLVMGALASLCFSWRSILAALVAWRRRGPTDAEPGRSGEVPRRWYLGGLGGALALSVVLQVAFFGITWWAAAVAVLLTFALALVAARVAGESGLSAVGAMGKITQLVFGLLVPRNPVPNLMAANVTGGAASQCADLLDDLKCGHLLGASPRLQTLAQVLGALTGALVGAGAYLLLVPDPARQVPATWPAPAALTWKAVAELFMVGFGALPRGTGTAMALAALVGIALPILSRAAPRAVRPFVLSPVCVGLGFILPAGITISVFIGGLAAVLVGWWFRSWSARFLVAICVGLIAGESLTGIGLAMRQVVAQ